MIVDIGKVKDEQELAQQLRYINSLDSLVESAKDDNERLRWRIPMIDNILVTKTRIEELRNELFKSSIIIDSPVKVSIDSYDVGRMVDNITLLLSFRTGDYEHQYKRGFSVYEHDQTNDPYIYIRQVLERDIERLEALRAHHIKYRGGQNNG